MPAHIAPCDSNTLSPFLAWILRGLLWLAVLVLPGCASLLRAPAVSERDMPPTDEMLQGMNIDLLCPSPYPSLRIEVDWYADYRPGEKAIAALKKCAAMYCSKPGGIEVVVDDPFTLEQALVPTGEEGTDGDAGDLDIAALADHRPADHGTYYLHVIYLGRGHFKDTRRSSLLGAADVAADGSALILMFREAIDRAAFLWIRPGAVERQVLLHEFGHVMGLVSSPAHSSDGYHCINPGCAMYRGVDVRSVLVNLIPGLFLGRLPNGFCHECKADLSSARNADPAGR